MGNPTTSQARVGCSGLVLTPRAYQTQASYPFSQTLAATLRSIQSVGFTASPKLAIEDGGETVHQINGYETDRPSKGKFSVERHDYLALQNIMNGTLNVIAANGNGPEQQYFAENYTDRAPYFSVVALSVNGDPTALRVWPKCKINGNFQEDWDKAKVTTLEIDFDLFWDYNYVRQDGTLGGITERVYSNGAATTLHS